MDVVAAGKLPLVTPGLPEESSFNILRRLSSIPWISVLLFPVETPFAIEGAGDLVCVATLPKKSLVSEEEGFPHIREGVGVAA